MYEEYLKLLEQAEYHTKKYYIDDDPEISDYDYDMLMQKIKRIEKEHPEWVKKDSPTQKVGGKAKRTAGVLVPHRVKMLSLQDVFTKEEVYDFANSVFATLGADAELVVETKIDGLSLSLRYQKEGKDDKDDKDDQNGNTCKLALGVTRGDGITQGEDVTANIRVIKDVVQTLKNPIDYLEVRGEVYMTNKAFDEVNEQQELLGKKIFANPRNCAAGTLRQLDSEIVRDRNLSLFIFNIQEAQGRTFKTHTEGYEYLRSNGIKTIDRYYICKSADEVWDAIQKIGEDRDSLEYGIDGAVVKLNNIDDRQKLGETSKVPKWAIAYKYPPERKETRVTDIRITVGRTGRITPTAIFEPIRLCGTTVTKATLHNQDYMDELGIGINSVISVYKSGDVIPRVESVVKHVGEPFKIPDICPECGEKAVRELDTADIKCVNPACPAQLLRTVFYFTSRDCMDVKSLGIKLIQSLIEAGYIQDYADIYYLNQHRDALISKGILGKEKNTDKVLAAIEASKTNDATMLLAALGIPNVAKSTAKEIMKRYSSILDLSTATEEELLRINDVGDITAKAITSFFKREASSKIVQKLVDAGVNMASIKKEGGSSILSGLTFVITGTLPTMGRTEASALLENAGAKISGSVSSKTNYLLCGEDAGSKLDKAKELGVKVISEEELLEMLK